MKYMTGSGLDVQPPSYRELVVSKVFVSDVQVGTRKRTADPEKVKALAESMDAIGLQQPIAVWTGEPNEILLVSGATRLAAAKLLGWEEIPAVRVEMDELDRELWEIDENLIRAELTPTEEADHVARRKELWEMRQKVGKVFPLFTGRGHEGFAADTAKKTGKTKRSVNQKVSRSKKVAPEVKAEIQGTALDTGVNLDALAKMEPAEQKAAVAKAKATGSKKVAKQEPKAKQTREDGGYKAVVHAFTKATPEARGRFVSWLVNTNKIDLEAYRDS